MWIVVWYDLICTGLVEEIMVGVVMSWVECVYTYQVHNHHIGDGGIFIAPVYGQCVVQPRGGGFCCSLRGSIQEVWPCWLWGWRAWGWNYLWCLQVLSMIPIQWWCQWSSGGTTQYLYLPLPCWATHIWRQWYRCCRIPYGWDPDTQFIPISFTMKPTV